MTDSEQVIKNYKVKSNVDKLAIAILDVMEVAQSHGVRCWLNYGALLGLVRENRLLPWNDDAEPCCWFDANMKEKFKLITDDLNKKGYHAIFYSTMGSISAKRKGVVVNINIYWREGQYAVRPQEIPSRNGSLVALTLHWIAVFMGAYPMGFLGNRHMPLSIRELIKIILIGMLRNLPFKLRKRLIVSCFNLSRRAGGIYQKTAIPAAFFDKFETRYFYGRKILVPANPARLLRYIYGEGWRIPKVDWSFYHEKNKTDTGISFIDEMWDYSQMDII